MFTKIIMSLEQEIWEEGYIQDGDRGIFGFFSFVWFPLYAYSTFLNKWSKSDKWNKTNIIIQIKQTINNNSNKQQNIPL